MPLTWNATTVPEANRAHDLFQSAIWNSIAIGIGNLTELTLQEAMVRTRLLETWNGPYAHDSEGKPIYLWEVLPLFVGLKTNVSYESKTKWLGYRHKLWMEDVRDVLRQTTEATV